MFRAKRNAFVFALIVALGGFVFGLDLVLIAGTFDYTEAQFGLTAAQKGMIAAGPGWGALVALIFAGYVSDRVGRKNSLLIIAALYTVSAIGSALATDFHWLFVYRLIGGLAFTSLSLASMYIGEIAPPSMRGKLVGMNQLNIAVGLAAGSALSSAIAGWGASDASWTTLIHLNNDTAWRWMLGIEAIPAIIWFLLLLLIPESPRWLILNDKHEKAQHVISRITPHERIRAQFDDIVSTLKDTHHSINYIDQAKLLTSKALIVPLSIGLILAVVQPWTGMNPLQSFMPQIFEYAGRGATKLDDQALVNTIGVLFTLAALFMIDHFGRRKILIGGLTACAIGWAIVVYGFAVATYSVNAEVIAAITGKIDPAMLTPIFDQVFHSELAFKGAVVDLIGEANYATVKSDLLLHSVTMNAKLVLAGIILFVCAYNFSIGPVLWILFSELFPTKVRALGITACAWVTTIFGGILVQLLFPLQIEWFGSPITFMVYASFCVFGLISLAKLCPETKGKTIEEIEAEFAKRAEAR